MASNRIFGCCKILFSSPWFAWVTALSKVRVTTSGKPPINSVYNMEQLESVRTLDSIWDLTQCEKVTKKLTFFKASHLRQLISVRSMLATEFTGETHWLHTIRLFCWRNNRASSKPCWQAFNIVCVQPQIKSSIRRTNTKITLCPYLRVGRKHAQSKSLRVSPGEFHF